MTYSVQKRLDASWFLSEETNRSSSFCGHYSQVIRADLFSLIIYYLFDKLLMETPE